MTRQVCTFLAFLGVAIALNWLNPLGVENATTNYSGDLFNRIVAPTYPSTKRDRITVVPWTDTALEQLGWQWPISRLQHAQVLSSIRLLEPKAVMADYVILDEPETVPFDLSKNGSTRWLAWGQLNHIRQSIIQQYCRGTDYNDSIQIPVDQLSKNESNYVKYWIDEWIAYCNEFWPLYDEITAYESQSIPLYLVAGLRENQEVVGALKDRVQLVGGPKKLGRDGVVRTYPARWPESTNPDHSADGTGSAMLTAAFRLYEHYRTSGTGGLSGEGWCEQTAGVEARTAQPANEYAETCDLEDCPGTDASHSVGERDRAPEQAPRVRDFAANHEMYVVWGSEPGTNKNWLRRCSKEKGLLTRLADAILRGEYLREGCPYSDMLPVQLLFEEGFDKEVCKLIHNRYVFYGSGISSAADIVNTPVHGALPGVFLHAMAFDNLITFDGQYKFHDSRRLFLDLDIAILAMAILLVLLYMRFNQRLRDRVLERIRIKQRIVRGSIGLTVHFAIWFVFFLIVSLVVFFMAWLAYEHWDLAPGNWVGIIIASGVFSLAVNRSLLDTLFGRSDDEGGMKSARGRNEAET